MPAIGTKRRAAALVTAAGVLAFGTFVGSSAQATVPSATPTARSATSGIPALVDAAADLGRHAAGPQQTWFDSIYFTSSVKANGQEFGIQVHTRILPNRDEAAYRWTLSVINKTTGWYKDYAAMVEPKDYRWSEGKLDIKAPGLSWTGDSVRQSVQVQTPWGSLDVQLVPTGPAMNYASTGVFNLADGVPNYEFALPEMRTSGTLVVDGEKHTIRGTSWLDRQWGEMPTSLTRWTWMNLSMPNGDKVAIWDTIGAKSKDSWATVLHPDGSYDVVDVEPLAQGASRQWTSPATGQTYPTRWRIRIPALQSELDVRVTGNPDQEIETPDGSGYLEATAAFTGKYNGKQVRGENYVEMTGEWNS
ncbi:putative secreted hydrolase [Thermocatellispora tengchongensis]|uniref:Putative secreted hydrolase n=1 Tax=Thermocatellispora tengchongensis TaxID=1073253 RepID=A0A840NY63_9ACTN|nr:lipocalin family protein [Thermocatellispora tengchongensis]MBB5130601.1 putative secreted hydrolase [Thermocatellispora tengchongensis]